MNRSELAGFPLLALAFVILGGLIAFEVSAVPVTPAAPPHRMTPGQPTAQPPAIASSGETKALLSQILARPVFNPDRRPVAQTARGADGLNRLTGIVLSGPEKLAIFAASAGGRPVIALKGEHLGAYEVTDITSAGVTVSGPNGTTIIVPSFDQATPPASKAPIQAVPERRLRPK